jgi:hypothetical protein
MHAIGEGFAASAIPTQELKQLIVKLRWIGLDDDAEEVGTLLKRVAPREVLPVGPLDTD